MFVHDGFWQFITSKDDSWQLISIPDILKNQWHSQINPAYSRQRISQPMRIAGPIQFCSSYMVYLFFFKSSAIFETMFLQNLWNNFPPKFLKQFSSKIFETIFLQNLWNKIPQKSFEAIFLQNLWNNFPPKSLKQMSSKIFETNFLQNLWNNFPPKSLKQFSSKIFETNFLQNI